VQTCRLRERTWRSARPASDTAPVYQRALVDAGWSRSRTTGCPTTPGYTCWERDEYVLDLWTRDASCDLAGLVPAPGTSAPSGNPSGPAPTPDGSAPPAVCAGSFVTAKVANRVDPNWHR
jgi:hypothetical protein